MSRKRELSMKRIIKIYFFSHFILIYSLYSQNPQWLNYTNGNSVSAIAIEGESVWIGFEYHGVAYLENPAGSLKYYTVENSGLPHNRVECIVIDADGIKWIGTRGGGLAKFDGENWTVYNRDNSDIPDDRVQAVAIDDSSNKWLGLRGEGVAKFDGEKWTNFNESNSDLPQNRVNCIAIDDSNNKWIGCDHLGMAKYNDKNWTIYNSGNTGLDFDRILCIMFDDSGNVWIGTEYAGLVMHDHQSWYNYDDELPLIGNGLIPSIAIDAMDNKWITGWYSGLTMYDGINYINYTSDSSGLPHNNTTAIAIDNLNNKWIGTGIGLAAFNENGIVTVGCINDLLPDNFTLKQNYPNPFNLTTTIAFTLSKSDKISIKIYNLTGQEIETLINSYQIAGAHEIKWQPAGIPSGIYFYRLQTGAFSAAKKLILQK